MPAGSAKRPIPRMATAAAAALPQPVTGATSPYPTVVSVATPSQAAAGMLLNASGWTSCSAY